MHTSSQTLRLSRVGTWLAFTPLGITIALIFIGLPFVIRTLQPVLDSGQTYPHHGLYFVTSDQWDLEVLGGLLLSDIAELFVATYCVKMRAASPPTAVGSTCPAV